MTPGQNPGHRWAVPLSGYGQILLTIDSRVRSHNFSLPPIRISQDRTKSEKAGHTHRCPACAIDRPSYHISFTLKSLSIRIISVVGSEGLMPNSKAA